MDTKSSKCVHLVEGGTNGSQYVNMAPMGKTSLGRVIHARKRQKTSFTNLETHGDGSGYLACDTCSSGVPNEIVPAGIVPIGNILVGNNIGFQTRTKGSGPYRRLQAWPATAFGNLFKAASNGTIYRPNTTILVREVHGLRGGGVTNEILGHGCRSKIRSIVANGCPYRRLRGLHTKKNSSCP